MEYIVFGEKYESVKEIYKKYKKYCDVSYQCLNKRFKDRYPNIDKNIFKNKSKNIVKYNGIYYNSFKELSKHLFPKLKSEVITPEMRKYGISHNCAIKRIMGRYNKKSTESVICINKSNITKYAYKFLYGDISK